MGCPRSCVMVLVLVGGCERKVPRLEGPVEVRFGDCAPPGVTFVSGPRPQVFDEADLDPTKTAGREDDPPPPEPDDSREGGAFASLTGTGDISSGFDDTNIYGGLLGNEEGEMTGGYGYGSGSGRQPDYTVGGGYGGLGRPRPTPPSLTIGQPSAAGDLDKAIIRRYIKRQTHKLVYCYEKELLAKPKLVGTITTTFLIKPDGHVTDVKASGFDKTVSECVATVISAIEFPKPENDGRVQVSYPFAFRPAGSGAGSNTPPSQPTQEPPPAPTQPEPPKPPKPDYVAGEKSPLRAIEKELVDCFRLQNKHHGIGVIDVGGETLKVHGIENGSFEKCVARLGKQIKADKTTCSVAFGPMSVEDAPGVDITDKDVKYLGTKVADAASVLADTGQFKIDGLFEKADAHAQSFAKDAKPVALAGPIVIRAPDSTPMLLVNRVHISLLAAGEDPVLAAKRGNSWALLRQIALPVVPVPVGTGSSWASMKTKTRDTSATRGDESPQLSVLVAKDTIWVGVSRVNEFYKVEGRKYDQLADALAKQQKSVFFSGRRDAEIAGENDVTYGEVVEVIEALTKAGFTNWVLTDPAGLSARPAH